MKFQFDFCFLNRGGRYSKGSYILRFSFKLFDLLRFFYLSSLRHCVNDNIAIMCRLFVFKFDPWFQASVLVDLPVEGLGDAETEQITSVIFGLLRQNSFTFLEVLEGARFVFLFFSFRRVVCTSITLDDTQKWACNVAINNKIRAGIGQTNINVYTLRGINEIKMRTKRLTK